MTRRRDLSPEEASLWRRVAKTTKAYKAIPAAVLPEATAPQVAPKASDPEMPHLVLRRAKATRDAPKRPQSRGVEKLSIGVADASGHKKVRRGKLNIDARIDLHGMRQSEAQAALATLIAHTRAEHGRCILVVTGKGRPVGSGEDYMTPGPGVIRRRLPEWLASPSIREHVSGFATAHAKDGGTGAYYVLLKSKTKP